MTFFPHSPILRGLGLALTCAGLAGSLLSVFLATAPFNFGIWNQSEPVIAGIHAGSALAALGLAVLSVASPRWGRRLLHPYVLVALALAVWSLFTSPFHRLPFLSWWGSPEVGEGVFMFLDMAVLIAAGIAVSRVRRLRIVFVLLSGAIIAAIMAGTWLFFAEYTERYTPYYFTDHLAFFGIFLVGTVVAFSSKTNKIVHAAAYLAGGIVIFYSGNRAAQAIYAVGLPLAWGLLEWLGRSGIDDRLRRALAAAGIVATSLAITTLIVTADFRGLGQIQDAFATPANSVVSRQRLLELVKETIKTQPASAWIGVGWGSYGDVLTVHLPVDWVLLRDELGKNDKHMLQGFWDAVHRVDFHSHNNLADALLGGGIVGTGLALATIAILPIWCRRRQLSWAGAIGAATAGTAAMWFQVPASYPFMALAWAAFAAPVKAVPAWFAGRRIVPIPFFVLAAIAGYAAASSWTFARYAYYFTPAMDSPLRIEGRKVPCPEYFDDGGRGGIHVAHRLRTFVFFALRDAEAGRDIDPAIVVRLRGLACAADAYVDRGGAVRLLIATLLARADLAFRGNHPALADTVVDYLQDWGERLDLLLRLAPKRTDIAAPYMLSLLNKGDEKRLTDLALRLFSANPRDSVALWFSGIALLGTPGQEQIGLARMREAIERGIERIIPVPPLIKERLGLPR